jgi:hypothetical protein
VLTGDVTATIGKVGLYTSGNGIAVFDDVTVDRPVAPADNGGQTPADNTTPGNTTTDSTPLTNSGQAGGGGCFIGTARR